MPLRALLFTFLLACLASTAAVSAELPESMTMHRLQAGEPDESGWMLAASSQGGFSVRLPLKFNDFTVSESGAKSAVLLTHVVGAKSAEGIKFMASRIVYRDGLKSAKRFFANYRRGKDMGGETTRVFPHRIGEWQAVDVDFGDTGSVAYQRAVLLGADLLLLSIEGPREHDAAMQQLLPVFFTSLAINKP